MIGAISCYQCSMVSIELFMHLKKSNLLVIKLCLYLCVFLPFKTQAENQLETYTVSLVKIPEVRTLNAQIEAVRQATVASQVRGRIVEIPYDVDDYVEKGLVLVRFRDREQRAAVQSAKAQFDEAQSAYKRMQEIYAKKLVAISALEKAEARLKSAKATLEQANETLENTIVRAPYSGIVVKRHVEVGELANIGQKLMTGLSLETLRATVELPQSMIHKVRQYKQATVYLGVNTDKPIKVESMSISPYADPMSHTFTTRLLLPQGDHKVYPGMYTKASFAVGEELTYLIPKSAVGYRGEVTAVYIKNKDNLLEFRQVRLGRVIDKAKIEILSGISDGEQVVLDPVKAVSYIQQQNRIETE